MLGKFAVALNLGDARIASPLVLAAAMLLGAGLAGLLCGLAIDWTERALPTD